MVSSRKFWREGLSLHVEKPLLVPHRAQNIAAGMPGKGSRDTWTRSHETRRTGAQPDSEERALCRCQHRVRHSQREWFPVRETLSTATAVGRLPRACVKTY